MNRVFVLAVLAIPASAGLAVPFGASPRKASQAWQLLKDSLKDQAPLLSAIRAEERKAKSSNLRASRANGTASDEVADSDKSTMIEEAEAAAAEAAAMATESGAAADAALEGKRDTRPVTDTASEFERDVTEMMLELGGTSDGKGNFAATPMGSSVRKMRELITKVMLKKVQDAHQNDQDMLDRLAKMFDACRGTKNTQLKHASLNEATYREKSPLHKSCRAMEANYATESKQCEWSKKQALTMAKLTCKSFDEIEAQVSSQVVNSNLVQKAHSEAPETYVRRLTMTICGSGGDGKGGSGKSGYLDKFLVAQEKCKKQTQSYNDKKTLCVSLGEKYRGKKEECDNTQAQMDNAACTWAVDSKDACENYVGCFSAKKTSYDTSLKVVQRNEKDRKTEYRGLRRMECLINSFSDGKVTNAEVLGCKKKAHDTSPLNIKYPDVKPLGTCKVPSLYPATPAYKRAEFAKLPAQARGQADANECTGVEEVSTTPAQYSPKTCKCERLAVLGVYSAGPLIKCTNCLDIYRSNQRNSCPRGTKLFSPQSPADWETIMGSAGPLRDPHWIVDVTRSADKCKGCSREGMNSKNPGVDKHGWETADESPWWITRKRGGLRMGSDHSIGIGYTASCYLNIASAKNANKVTFNAGFCNYHSKSYYCQPEKVSTRPKKGSPNTCTCTKVALTGRYSAGSLIKCENCWSTSKSRDKNSCPKGTKLFSPANRRDWKVVLDSGGPLRSPAWIVDVTRPSDGCPGCTKSPMRSTNPRQATWRTSDGSPWWLRSTAYSEPNGNYKANCYLNIAATSANEHDIRFDDKDCGFSSSSYYCQPARPRK